MSFQNVQRARHQVALESDSVALSVTQQPLQALVTNEHKEKTRKAIDPPPVVQLKVDESRIHDQRRHWIVSPFIFMTVMLVNRDVDPTSGEYAIVPGNPLLGLTVSSLNRLKDAHNVDGGFFVFGDISCRKTGTYRLQFNLFDQENERVVFVVSKVSEPFSVVLPKDFHGQRESTHLSRKFSEQGVRLRLRKEQRSIAGRKRSYDGSPVQASAPAIAPNLLPASQPDRTYGYPPMKRQRSDEYNASLYFQQNNFANNLYQYSANQPASNGYGMANQSGQNHQLDGRYSNAVGSNYSTTDAGAAWTRTVGQGQQYSNSAYLQAMRSQAAPSRQAQQGQITPLGGSDESLNALGGLHTPSSIPDTARTSTSSQPQNYLPPAQDDPTHASGYNAAQANYTMQHHQDEEDPRSNFGYRNSMSGQLLQGYQPNLHHSPTGPAFGQMSTERSLDRYSHSQFATTGGADNSYPETGRDSFQSDLPNLSENSAHLDSSILSRNFIPPYSNSQHQNVLEESTPHYKDLPYPTPHQTSPME